METKEFGEELTIELKKYYVDEFSADEWVKLWTDSPRLIVRTYYESRIKGEKANFLMNPELALAEAKVGKDGRDIIFLMTPSDKEFPIPSNWLKDAE